MQKQKRKPRRLKPWQIEDATRLNILFEKRSKLSQEAFGSEFGIGSQGAVWQYLTGAIPLNLTAALRFAKGLGVDVSAFSPTLSNEIEHLTSGYGPVLASVIDLMEQADRAEAIEFLRFKLQKAPGTEMLRGHYDALLDDIKRRAPQSAGPPALPPTEARDHGATWPLTETPRQAAERERREIEQKLRSRGKTPAAGKRKIGK